MPNTKYSSKPQQQAWRSRTKNIHDRRQNLGIILVGKTEDEKLETQNSVRDWWDTIKQPNMNLSGIPEGEESESGLKGVFSEIIAEKNHPSTRSTKRL